MEYNISDRRLKKVVGNQWRILMDREEKVERNWTVHPGRHLANFLEDHRLSKRKLAEQMQVPSRK